MQQEDSGPSTGLLAQCLEVPPEEVRFAVVLNGGVSLAVWMGGVVVELDRLTKAERSGTGPYSVLKRLTGCGARADVITGTSAGGINGAALALTQVNRKADPRLLRDLWIDQGRIETLLRAPFQGQPTSLLRGDEYFLPKLNAALELLAEKQETWWDPTRAPIDLTITTTVLSGNQAVSVDSMGQQLPQSLHAARFQWERHPNVTEAKDPFHPTRIKRTAHRLALASRSSASFPVAFEPSFVPVGSPDHKEPADLKDLTEEQRLRPDMREHVRAWGTGEPTSDRSRYCADGGALANTPTMAALQAIESMPASGPVRRVMLLVFPHAPKPGQDPPDSQVEPPSFVGSLSGVLGALTAQGSRSYVESLEQHNLVAAGRRGTRADVLAQIDRPEDLLALTTSIYGHYKRLRRWRAGRDLAAWRTGVGAGHDIAANTLPPGWSFERVRAAAQEAQDAWAARPPDGAAPLPYAPKDVPTAENVVFDGWGWGVTAALGVAEAVADLMRRLVFNLGRGQEFETVRGARQTALLLAEKLRDCRELTDACWRDEGSLLAMPPDEDYWLLRLACYDHLMLGKVSRATIDAKIARLVPPEDRAGEADVWRKEIADALEGTLAKASDGDPRVGKQVRDYVDQLVGELKGVLGILRDNAETLSRLDPSLPSWKAVFARDDEPEPDDTELLARLLQLEIAATTLGDEVTTGSSFPVDLVQVSAQTQNPFATYSRTTDEKLGGDSVNRFGGFLKRSWRVNDWMWGRADGATMLARTMLDPERLRRTAVLSGYLPDVLPPGPAGETPEQARTRAEGIAREKARDTVAGVIRELGLGGVARVADLRRDAVEELLPVMRPQVEGESNVLPSALDCLAAIFAWAVHLEAIPEELPALAGAIAADRVDGANTRSRGELFVEEHASLLRRLDAAASSGAPLEMGDRVRALEVFDRAGIGWEPMREETSSDLIIRTATSAAAVMATVADSDRSGLGGAKPVTRAFRGAMLLPYWAIYGLTSRQTIARGLALLAFALGGASLALALFGVLSPTVQPIATALGTGALLGAFAYGALRTGSLLHGIVLLTPVIPLVAYANEKKDENVEGLSTLAIVLAFALGLMLLGSIGVASGSVWAALDRLADRKGLVRPRPPKSGTWWARAWYATRLLLRRIVALLRVVGTLLFLAALVGAVAAAVWFLVDRDRLEWVQDNHRWLWAVALGVAIAGGAMAHVGGRWLQVLTRRAGRTLDYAAVVNPGATSAGWAVVYGLLYLVTAWVISLEWLDDRNPEWRQIAFATAAVFAVVLLLVLPWLLPLFALADVGRTEVRRARDTDPVARPASDIGADESEATARHNDFAYELVVRGSSYRRFVSGKSGAPRLTRYGQRLEQRVCDARAAGQLLRLWQAPRVPAPSDVLALGEVLDAWAATWGARLSPKASKRLQELQDKLEPARGSARTAAQGGEPPTWAGYAAEVRHGFDRLIVALGRGSRKQSLPKRIWAKLHGGG